MANASTGYFFTRNVNVYKTQDNGESWKQTASTDLAGIDNFEKVYFENSTGYAAGYKDGHGVIYNTHDDGVSWTLQHKIRFFIANTTNQLQTQLQSFCRFPRLFPVRLVL